MRGRCLRDGFAGRIRHGTETERSRAGSKNGRIVTCLGLTAEARSAADTTTGNIGPTAGQAESPRGHVPIC